MSRTIFGERLGQFMDLYSLIFGAALFIGTMFQVFCYMTMGEFSNPHPDFNSGIVVAFGQAITMWGIPSGLSLAPGLAASIVKRTRGEIAPLFVAIGWIMVAFVFLTLFCGAMTYLAVLPLTFIRDGANALFGSSSKFVWYAVTIMAALGFAFWLLLKNNRIIKTAVIIFFNDL